MTKQIPHLRRSSTGKLFRAGSSQELYALRRRIMTHLYRARELTGKQLPWIRIRIVSFNEKDTAGRSNSLGILIKNNLVEISERMVKWSDITLKYIVFHELAHKYFAAPHTDKPHNLMNPEFNYMSNEEIERQFVELARKGE